MVPGLPCQDRGFREALDRRMSRVGKAVLQAENSPSKTLRWEELSIFRCPTAGPAGVARGGGSEGKSGPHPEVPGEVLTAPEGGAL